MAWQLRNLAGAHFGRLTVLRLAGFTKRKTKDGKWRSGSAIWLCLCECGTAKDIRGASLTARARGTQSCGCLAHELAAARLIGKRGQDSIGYGHSVHGQDERG